ncbi:MAG: hypothetical protein ACREXR_08760 [Gammaproteobacteria bacterium]
MALRKHAAKALIVVAGFFSASIFAGTPGDTASDSSTYCTSGGSCTTVTVHYVLNINHQWEIARIETKTFQQHTHAF